MGWDTMSSEPAFQRELARIIGSREHRDTPGGTWVRTEQGPFVILRDGWSLKTVHGEECPYADDCPVEYVRDWTPRGCLGERFRARVMQQEAGGQTAV